MIANLPQHIAVCLAVCLALIAPASGQTRQPVTTGQPNLSPEERNLIDAFEKSYGLADGQMVRRVMPPFHPGRLVRYRHTHLSSQVDAVPDGPDNCFLRWSEANGLESHSEGYGVPRLETVIESLVEISKQEIEGNQELLDAPIRGDWIVRKGTEPEQVVPQLERILRDEVQLPVRLSLQDVLREVIVAKGEFHLTPIGASRRIEIYGETLVPKGGGGGSGDLDELLQRVGAFIDRRIVNEAEAPQRHQLKWHYNVRFPHSEFAKEDRDVRGVLQHLTEQTGLSFSWDRRRVRVLMVEKVSSPPE